MRKTTQIVMVATALVTATASCSSGDSMFDDIERQWNNGIPDMPNGQASGQSASIGDLTSFDITIDTSELEESETVPNDDEDYIENNDFTNVVNIVYNGGSASVSGATDGITVTTDGAFVTVNATVKACYELSGTTTNGGLKIYSEKKYAVRMNGVNIINPTGPVINSQSKKRGYFIITDGTENTLADGTSYTASGDEDMKGTIFSEGELLFSGKGKLNISANCKSGIASDDYVLFRPGNNIYIKATQGNGVKANDAILVNGGVINIETSGTAAKGLSSDSIITINGGRTTILTTGGGEYDSSDRDTKASAGVKSDNTFTMNGGELYLKSTGAGGKGINCGTDLTINDGVVKIITTGSRYSYNSLHSSPKGIKAEGNLTINGGSVAVRSTGGEGAEGIESKQTLTINAGTVEVYAYDDAINAKKSLTISGGYIFTYATNNDGIDSNGPLTITGGVAIACGTTQPEDGFDCDQNTFTISGGTVIGIGGSTSTPNSNTCKQAVAVVGGTSIASDSYISLADSKGSIICFKVPRSYSQYTLLLSSPSMSKGNSYTISTDCSVNGGTDFDGYLTGATVSGGNTLASLSLSDIVTTYNFSGGMGPGGGGGPGGWSGGW